MVRLDGALSTWSPAIYPIAAIILSYFMLVRTRRYARLRRLEAQFSHLVENPSKMSYVEAHSVIQLVMQYDMPYLAILSLEFALFQTYAVPTISKLLLATRRLGDAASNSRRAEDTFSIIAEFNINSIDSERGSEALARMNWIHSRYGRAISRNDLLLTLSLFIIEPVRICGTYDWRPFTDMERQARFVYWREVGARMGITDIPPTYDELAQWKANFEQEAMVFTEANKRVADLTMDTFVRPYPSWLRPIVRNGALALVPEVVRKAFGWNRAPSAYYTIVPAVLRVRSFIIRHFFLPRSLPKDYGFADEAIGVDERGARVYVRNDWLLDPFYVKPTWSNTMWSLLGQPVPGPEYRPSGYTLPSLGPEDLRELGNEEVQAAARATRERAKGGGCPFAQL